MEKYASLIANLLQHSERFLDFWNFQIVISLAMIGFLFSNPAAMNRYQVRLFISLIFIGIAAFSIFSLSVHQQREELLWNALEARINAEKDHYLPEEIAYIDSLKPTSFPIKAGALGLADLVVVGAILVAPAFKSARRPTGELDPHPDHI
jgi:uncharacterized membrane protein